jgi:zinc transporter 1/2/3
MDFSLRLRIVAIFEIFFISLIGVYLPQYLVSHYTIDFSKTLFFRSLKAFSGGLVVSVAFCHLLAHSVSELNDDQLVSSTPGYPLAMSLALTGVIFLVVLDQMTIVVLDMIDKLPDNKVEVKASDCSVDGIEAEFHSCSAQSMTNRVEIREDKENTYGALDQGTTGHVHANNIDSDNYFKLFFKLVIFESAIVLHSVIIGFELGILSNTDVNSIQSLMIALAFHQFFEGFSLGTMISSIRRLSFSMNVLLMLVFALTTPIGIVIGITTSETSSSHHAKGVASGLAGGFLIYTGLVEILMEELMKETSKEISIVHRPVMCLSMCLGASFMAILAIWA